MRLLLTFLTITLFSFGASAKYNFKLKEGDCTIISDSASIQSYQYFKSVNEGNAEKLEFWKKSLVETAIIYQAFCKD